MPNIVILTGAGMSAESGISTFRDAGGLWENHNIEDVASPAGFRRDSATVHRFYNLRRAQLHSVQPNAGHLALAELEAAWKGRGNFLLVTQNVDDLHERAGSKNLLHMHGELRKILCTACHAEFRYEQDVTTASKCPACGAAGKLRPAIVWFGEIPRHMDEIFAALEQADIFAAIGTSGIVYPAAGFADAAANNGRHCAVNEINPAPTGNPAFHLIIQSPATTGVAQFAKTVLMS
jgi:NAD-dependent deacetylase